MTPLHPDHFVHQGLDGAELQSLQRGRLAAGLCVATGFGEEADELAHLQYVAKINGELGIHVGSFDKAEEGLTPARRGGHGIQIGA